MLQQLQTTHSTSALHDSTTLSTLLQRLSTLIRAALRTVNGEDEEFEHPGFEMSVTDVEKPYSLADVLADIQNIPTSSPINRPRTGTATQNRWLGDQGVSGGYAGKSMARLDWSIEREGEIIRLEEENRLLREMLGVSKDFEPQVQQQEQDQQQPGEQREQSQSPQVVQEPEAQTDQLPLGDTQEHHEEDATTETAEPESASTDENPKEEIAGYRVLSNDDQSAVSDTTNVASASGVTEEAEKAKTETSGSAIADDDEELPGSPPLTAAASLVRSLSTSPQSRFKPSPKLLKSATYSGGSPKSPPMNRSNASTPIVAQSSGSATASGQISSPNPSLSSIFPRQAKTEPTTATTTTTTAELEDTDVAHTPEVQKPGSASVPAKATNNSGSTNAEDRPAPKSKIEIKKAQPPSLPGSPLGKTPPKTGITLDHAVESRVGTGTTDDSTSHERKDKTSIESGQKGRKTKAERLRNAQATKKTDTEHEQKEEMDDTADERPKVEDTKLSYAEVAKEDAEE